MPSWNIHKKWDSEFGIPSEVSDYIQKAIDSKGLSDKKVPMPEDFQKHTEERKLRRSRGKNFAIADLSSNLHDRARSKIIQVEDLKFLLGKGGVYVEAYYLHFILDYLDHPAIRQWIQVTGDSIADCVDKYYKNKAVYIPETYESLKNVINYLKTHSHEVEDDLNI